jgi:protein arginine N-methyltransferase 1
MPLKRDTEIKLASDVQLSLVGGELEIRAPHGLLRYDREVLRVLAAFIQPRLLGEAVDALSPTARPHEWAEDAALVLELVDAGVLLADGKTMPALAHDWRSYSAPSVHIMMLDDTARTTAFVEAIRAAVRPGDVVVDIGTGTGVLALAAAQAGAARVYAIERSSIAETAAAVFHRAGVSDRITLVRGHSTQIELPERCDLLVSELVGDEPLAERLLEVTADALRRHLKPNARAIPKRLSVYATAVTIADAELKRHLFDEAHVRAWRDRYRLDLSGVLDASPGSAVRFFVEPGVAAGWRALSAPVELAVVDVLAPDVQVEGTVQVPVLHEGRFDGAVIHFDLELDDVRRVTTKPGAALGDCHWLCPVWALPRRTPVGAGEVLTLRYRHDMSRTILAIER